MGGEDGGEGPAEARELIQAELRGAAHHTIRRLPSAPTPEPHTGRNFAPARSVWPGKVQPVRVERMSNLSERAALPRGLHSRPPDCAHALKQKGRFPVGTGPSLTTCDCRRND